MTYFWTFFQKISLHYIFLAPGHHHLGTITCESSPGHHHQAPPKTCFGRNSTLRHLRIRLILCMRAELNGFAIAGSPWSLVISKAHMGFPTPSDGKSTRNPQSISPGAQPRTVKNKKTENQLKSIYRC